MWGAICVNCGWQPYCCLLSIQNVDPIKCWLLTHVLGVTMGPLTYPQHIFFLVLWSMKVLFSLPGDGTESENVASLTAVATSVASPWKPNLWLMPPISAGESGSSWLAEEHWCFKWNGGAQEEIWDLSYRASLKPLPEVSEILSVVCECNIVGQGGRCYALGHSWERAKQ